MVEVRPQPRVVPVPRVLVLPGAGEGHHVPVSLRVVERVDDLACEVLVCHQIHLLRQTVLGVVEELADGVDLVVLDLVAGEVWVSVCLLW